MSEMAEIFARSIAKMENADECVCHPSALSLELSRAASLHGVKLVLSDTCPPGTVYLLNSKFFEHGATGEAEAE